MTELPAFRDRSRGLWVAVGLLVALALGAWLAYRPAKQWVITRRGRELAREAEIAITNRLLVTTSEKLRGALQMAPNDPEIQRVAAHFLSLNGQAKAFGYWELLITGGHATLEDRQAMVRLALLLSRLDLVQNGLTELLQLNPTNQITQELVLDQLLALGNWRGAEAAARLALTNHPASLRPRLVLSRALLASGRPDSVPEAVSGLRALAATTNEVQIDAWRALLAVKSLPNQELQTTAESLLGSPEAHLADKLAALDTEWRLDPDSRQILPDRAQGLLDSDRDEADLIQVADWLRRHGAIDRVDALLPAAAAEKNEALFLARIELLTDLKRLDEALQLVERSQAVHNPDAIACANALIAHTRGRRDEVATHLSLALEKAGTRWSRIHFIANYAQQLGHPGIAIEGWGRLLEDPRYGFTAAQQLIANLPDKSYANLERRAYHSLARMLPKDPEYQAQDAYFDLLAGENVDRSLGVFQRLVATYPDSENLSVGLALGLLRKNHPEEALTTIESRKIDWPRAEPHYRAIYAAILAANHQLRDARLEAGRLDLKTLRPLEQKLVADLLSSQ